MMDRTIHRRYGLTPTEVRAAIVDYIKSIDLPYPVSSDFNLTVAESGGVVIYWTEDDEVKA